MRLLVASADNAKEMGIAWWDGDPFLAGRKDGRLEDRLKRLEQAKDDLTQLVVHDLKAPLRSIKGFTQAIADDYANSLDAAGKDSLRRVIAASERMTQLIDAMLSMSRFTRREPEKQMVNLSDMARVISSELKQKEPERQVEFIIADGVRRFDGLPKLFLRVEEVSRQDQRHKAAHSGGSEYLGPCAFPRMLL